MSDQNELNVSDAAASESPSAKLSGQQRTIIGILMAAVFVAILNEAVMAVALPVVMKDLQIDARTGQWLIAGFMLTMAVVIPITGFLIRRFPTRTLYGAAMVLFSTGTLIAATSPGFPFLLAARVIQASGTAVMVPLLMTTVMALVPSSRRGTVMGTITLVVATAPAIGPLAAGIVLNVAGWRWLFWLVLPISVLALVFGWIRLINVGETSAAPIDILSVVLSVLGFGGLVYGLSGVGSAALPDSKVSPWVPLTVGGVSLLAFVARQVALQRSGRAVLDLRTFRSRTFTMASVVMFLQMMVLVGTAVLLPIYLQDVLALTPMTTGLLLVPGGLLMGVLGPVAGQLYDRRGVRAVLVPGVFVMSGALWFGSTLGDTSTLWHALGFHVALNVGMAFVITPLTTVGLGSLEPHLYSYGSSMLGTIQQVAGAAGVALLVTVTSVRSASLLEAGASRVAQTAGGIHAAYVVAALMSLAAISGALLVRQSTSQPVHR